MPCMKTLNIFLLFKGRVDPCLEELSINFVFYCYFNVHHRKITSRRVHQGRRLYLACTVTKFAWIWDKIKKINHLIRITNSLIQFHMVRTCESLELTLKEMK